jgi:hypothetical protein
MKQLYAAGPLARGDSPPRPNGPNGHAIPAPAPTVRAASAGLRPDEVRAALACAAYAPPAPAADAGRPLPVRLALLNTPAGRLLTHVAPNGGTYFAHTLLNLPAMADAQLAAQTWGSPFWQRHDPDSASDLPELPYLPVADVLGDEALRAWLAAPARRELLEFVLSALLATPPAPRIFLAAPADDVARVLYAVTRALPPGLLDDFTFSTYEPDPLACPARLVGFDPGAAAGDLPAACYANGAAAFNAATGRRTEAGAEVPFAAFAASALARGEYAALDEVKAAWQRLGLKNDARQLDLVFRMARGTGVLTKQEAAEALRHPPLAAWLSARADALQQFLEWALEDREFATTSFFGAVQALRQKPDVMARLTQTVRDLGLRALQAGDRDRAANALEVVLPMVAPAKAGAVWGELLGLLPDPGKLSWEVRWYLLPRLVRFKQPQPAAGTDPALAPWLDVPADKLGELLALDLPRAYPLAAGRACLARDGEPSAAIVQTLVRHPALALALLQPAGPGGNPDRPVRLFEGLLAEAPSRPWLENLLARPADYPAGLLNRFFEAALSAGKVDADRLVRAQGPRLLEVFAGQSGLDRVGTQLLADPPADLLHNRDLLDFLGKLRNEPHISDALKGRLAAVQAIRAYLDAPAFKPEVLAPTAAALAVSPPVVPPSARAEVLAAVAGELARRAKGDTTQADLEAALAHLGGVLADGPSGLYESLLRDLRGRTSLGRSAELVHAFLAVALGAAQAPELAGKFDGLEGHAFALAAEAARRGGKRVLTEIDRRSEAWPRAVRTQWGFLRAAVRPHGPAGFLRDAGLLLAGAAAATVAWWATQFVGR